MSHFSTEFFKVSQPIPHVLHIQISRKPVNAFTPAVWLEYGALFEKIALEGEDVRAVVVSSAFPKVFCGGIDLSSVGSLNSNEAGDTARSAFRLHKVIKDGQHAIGAPERSPFPVIVAVQGQVIGLGVDLICACDIRYASANTSFSIKEVDIGMAADIGTLAYMPKITGNSSLVRELAYTARPFSAAEAEKIGLVSKVVDADADVVKAALDLAAVISLKSPVGISGTKKLLNHARDHSVAENLDYTAVWNGAALQTTDMAETLFATKAKRKANFSKL